MTEAAPAATPPAAPPATPPAPPATPLSPAAAASKLAELRGNAEWGEKVLKSDPGALKELRDLSKQVAEGGDLDAMIVAAAGQPDTNVNGELSLRKVAGEIPSLRESGLSDDVIKELLSGRESTPQEVDAVKRFKAMRHGNSDWVKKYLAGDHEAVRESRLMSMVLLAAAPS
jgi:hypothetical protein